MKGEPQYSGKVGVINTIDSLGQLHGTWGGLAIIPEEDQFEIIEEGNQPSFFIMLMGYAPKQSGDTSLIR